MAALAIVLIFGNSFPNALSLSSLENKARLHYASTAKLNTGEGVNKILMLCSLSSHSCVALPNIYGLYVELVLVVSCLRLLLLTPEGACISLML
jgi:hypothetical protein